MHCIVSSGPRDQACIVALNVDFPWKPVALEGPFSLFCWRANSNIIGRLCCSAMRDCRAVIYVCSHREQDRTPAGIRRASRVASVRSCLWISSTSIERGSCIADDTTPRRWNRDVLPATRWVSGAFLGELIGTNLVKQLFKCIVLGCDTLTFCSIPTVRSRAVLLSSG